MYHGYVRVSATGDRSEPQRQALQQAGCAPVHIWTDACAATVPVARRQGLQCLLAQIGHGDTLLVANLARVGGTLSELVRFIANPEPRRHPLPVPCGTPGIRMRAWMRAACWACCSNTNAAWTANGDTPQAPAWRRTTSWPRPGPLLAFPAHAPAQVARAVGMDCDAMLRGLQAPDGAGVR